MPHCYQPAVVLRALRLLLKALPQVRWQQRQEQPIPNQKIRIRRRQVLPEQERPVPQQESVHQLLQPV
jgi:hypothetical protein